MKKIIITFIIIGLLLIVFVGYKIFKPIDWIDPPKTVFQDGTYSYEVKKENGEVVYVADLVIKNLYPNFDFSIIAVTAGGSIGEIKGTAESITPIKAQAKINEFEKFCTLTFEVISNITPFSIKVTEDDCSEYQGKNTQFEHQYIKTK